MQAIAITFWILWVLVVLLRLVTAYFGHEAILDDTSPNLLGNPDFEDDILTSGSSFKWYIAGSSEISYQKITTNCISGNACISVTDRLESWRGAKSRVDASSLVGNGKYWFSMFIRYTKDNGIPFEAKYMMQLTPKEGSVDWIPLITGQLGVRATNEWLYIGTEVIMPANMDDYQFFDLYPDPVAGIDYVVDATSLRLLNNSHWMQEANQNIETHRKGTINIQTDIPACYNSADISIELEQTSGTFGIGTNVEAGILNNQKAELVDGYNMAYSKYFQSHYNWAQLPEDMKWQALEGDGKDTLDFTDIDGVLGWLHAYKYNVRGHFLHSNIESEHPDWVQDITNSTLFTEDLERRVDYMTSHFTGNLQMAHWDVSYNHMTSTYLQDKTDNPDILVDLIDRTKTTDPEAKTFFDVSISQKEKMGGIVNFARDLLNKTENIDGISATASFTNAESSADIEFIQKRLDVLNTFGLPIWVTDLKIPLMANREIFIRNLLLLLFGNPNVEGIMIEDLTDFTQTYTGGGSLINNNLGLVFDTVMNTMFKTRETVTPRNSGEETTTVKGFYGSYRMTVKHLTSIASTTYFDLTKDKDTDLLVTFDCPGTF